MGNVNKPHNHSSVQHSLPKADAQAIRELKMSSKAIAESAGDAFQPAQITDAVKNGKFRMRSDVTKKASKHSHDTSKLAMKFFKQLSKYSAH